MWSASEPPESIVVDGCEYIRADVAQVVVAREPSIERTYSVRELADASGIPASTLYRAVRGGALRALMPNGTTRGLRVLASDYERWMQTRASG